MQRTKSKLGVLVLALGLSTGAMAQEGPVKYRQAIMQAVSGHSGAIAQIAYGGVGHTDQLEGHARALAEVTKLVATAFKEKALTEDPPTRAKSAIWEKWSEFDQKAADLGKAAADVAAAAQGGDLGAVAASLDPLWESCKSCHKSFRKKQ